ncbi:hypothetical protein CSKR_101169 [Clonorchis sinensis]|uniref:Uncharacterized protein n=1 Tax=Clonorchis sinensis TaxID=79923 RepID=A0A419Q8Q3_CLOSI|nr:hypothetical protein CSKR_101169 [Clonorchis sinensis]
MTAYVLSRATDCLNRMTYYPYCSRMQHRCFHKYGHAGHLGETPYCLHTPVAEDSTTLPPDRLVARLLVVRGLAALGLTAPLWPSWHGCTLWNDVPASVARGIIAALKPNHHVKVAALGRADVLKSHPGAVGNIEVTYQQTVYKLGAGGYSRKHLHRKQIILQRN